MTYSTKQQNQKNFTFGHIFVQIRQQGGDMWNICLCRKTRNPRQTIENGII